MLAAAGTLWLMFAVWISAPTAGLPRAIERAAAVLLGAELVALLAWSYGTEQCDGRTCAPLAQASGVAARVDIPVLAVLLLVAGAVQLRRRAALTAQAGDGRRSRRDRGGEPASASRSPYDPSYRTGGR
jgi:hypothetical protein